MSADKKNKIRFPVFRDRLDEMRGEMSYAEFAEKLGLSRATVGFYLAGDRIPDALSIRHIAQVCNVTADYLLGLEDCKNHENSHLSKSTGLNEKALNNLSFLINTKDIFYSNYPSLMLNELIGSDDLVSFLHALYQFYLASAKLNKAENGLPEGISENRFNNQMEKIDNMLKELCPTGRYDIIFNDEVYDVSIARLQRTLVTMVSNFS